MKRAKIMLSVIIFFAISGGVFAFGITKISKVFYYKTDPVITALCNITTILPYTFLTAPNVAIIAGYYTTTVTTCAITTIYFDN
jgi:hypothetical protein